MYYFDPFNSFLYKYNLQSKQTPSVVHEWFKNCPQVRKTLKPCLTVGGPFVDFPYVRKQNKTKINNY